MTEAAPALVPAPPPVRIDLGCGTRKKEGFVGVDSVGFEGVDVVCNVGVDRWPWNDDSVDEAHASHLVEHLVPDQRIHFVNELHRVLKKGATAQIIVPHWCAGRAYGDLTHEWPPVTEFWFWYLSASWRKTEAPHETRYTCDFDFTQPGYEVHSALQVRSQEYVQWALQWLREAPQNMIATLKKK